MGFESQKLGRVLRSKITGSFEQKLRRSANPLLLQTRAKLGQPYVTSGKLSVIIPVYNVERYLRECLQSVQDQNYPDLEILVINDGSTDGSAKIAEEFARDDSRFRLVSKKNAGLGAARNTGIRLARGQFITFLDSDDAIPYDAYKKMITSLVQSGSDFVVGGVERWQGKTKWKAEWATRVHSHDRLGISLDDLPEVTMDVFAWNKVFKKDFFDESIGYFPEGILYEDQVPTAKAYTHSRHFDVLADTAYFWRVREDGSSITQNKLKIRDLRDRIAVAKETGSIYKREASPKVYKYWLQKTAGFDFGHYYRLSVRAGKDYRAELVNFTRDLYQELSEEDWGSVNARERILAHLISENDFERAKAIVGAQAQYTHGVPVTHEGEFMLDMSGWGVSSQGIPQHILKLSEGDTPLRTGMHSIKWDDEEFLVMQGYAFIDKIRPSEESTNLQLFMDFEDGSSQELSVVLESYTQDEMNRPMNSFIEYLKSKVTVRIPVTQAMEKHQRASFRFVLKNHGITRTGQWIPQSIDQLPRLQPLVTNDGNTYTLQANRSQGYMLKKTEHPAIIEYLSFSGRKLRMRVEAVKPIEQGNIQFVCLAAGLQTKTKLPALGAGESAELELDLPIPKKVWQQAPLAQWDAFISLGMERQLLPFPQFKHEGQLGGLGLELYKSGHRLLDHPWKALIHEVVSADGGFTIHGQIFVQTHETPKLVFGRLDGSILEPHAFQYQSHNGEFSATFIIGRKTEFGKPYLSPTSGTYGLCLLPENSEDIFTYSTVAHFDLSLGSGVRYDLKTQSGNAVVTDTGTTRSVLLRLGPPRSAADHRNKTRLPKIERVRNQVLSEPIRTDIALCMSFSGTSTDDSPRAVAREMLRTGLVTEVVWGVNDMDLNVDDGMRKVPLDSSEFIRLLHSAQWLINNAHFPHYFRKRAEQIYLQTWHGTPLKKIANDVPPTSLSDSYLDLMSREVSYWDVLLAQSPIAGTLLKKAFGFSGQVVAEGYPRNDVLFDPTETRALRTAFRQTYGLTEEQHVILFAPTWRDNAISGLGAETYEVMDFERLADVAGKDCVILVRGHSNTLNFARTVHGGHVLDVSGHNNLGQLFASSDLLITDYSSIFFDYMLTGKPIVGYVPDLDEYVNSVRGTYFDYLDVFPGPVARTNSELFELLRGWPTPPATQSPLIKEILEFEGGRASEKVVKMLSGIHRER